MTSITELRIPILYGSVREARQGIRAARFIEAQLRRRGHAPTLVDPAERRLPLLNLHSGFVG